MCRDALAPGLPRGSGQVTGVGRMTLQRLSHRGVAAYPVTEMRLGLAASAFGSCNSSTPSLYVACTFP
jgi:hypothetical protein